MYSKNDQIMNAGDYIVIQRWNFMKILHFGGNKGIDFDVVLGNDIVNISNAVGKPYWSTFKLVPEATPKKSRKRLYKIELCDGIENSNAELIKSITSGSDNRDIHDDGKSQNLSTENIHDLRDSGTSADEIMGQLIENSTTFQKKTEYAQEKYLSKKKRKYCDYILLRPTSLRLLIEINNKKDASKFLGMSMDTLSHLVTACNIQPGGNYLTYENGCSGIISAMILNYLDTSGKVLQIHHGPYPQKSSVLSLNFDKNKLNCYVPVSVRDITKIFESINEKSKVDESQTAVKQESDTVQESSIEMKSDNSSTESSKLANEIEHVDMNITNDNGNNSKRKLSIGNDESNKRSCLEMDPTLKNTIMKILNDKVDGLVIACKEYPIPIVIDLIKYVAPSRPVIVYSLYREPLVDLYLELKTSKHSVVNVRLTESFLRTYQVLPERTHPHMSMTSTGGYILVATVVDR